MAQYPSLPLFTDAYMADTRHLTAAQHGAYLLLLMTAWRMPDCKLPDDDKFLARCASMDARTWKANKPIVMAFWKQDDEQKFYQGRLLDERKYVNELSCKNSRAVKARWLKNNNSPHTTVIPNSYVNDTPTPTPTPIHKTIEVLLLKKPIKDCQNILPEWMPVEEWQAFKEMRIRTKKPMTDYAERLIFTKLENFAKQGFSAVEILNQSTISNYQTVYQPKENQNYANNRKPEQPKQTFVDIIREGTLAARAERERERSEQN